jgi:hypothetical protein
MLRVENMAIDAVKESFICEESRGERDAMKEYLDSC